MDSAKANRIAISIIILLIIAGTTIYLIYDQIQPKAQTKVEVGPVQNAPQQSEKMVASRTRKQRSARVAEAMPQLELRALDGAPLRLADFSGRFVLVQIWSANVPRSIDEMRNLKPIYDKFLADPRLLMIGLSTEQDIDALKQFTAENSINWLQGTAAPNASAATKEFLSNPSLLILGKDGSIIERPEDWWDAFCILSEFLPRIRATQPTGVVIDFEQIANQPTDTAQTMPFKRIPPPSADDAGTGAKVSIVEGRLHGQSGTERVVIDGKLPPTNDSPTENFFFIAKSIEGRFLFDFGHPIPIKQINSYTWHGHDRSAQVFRLYASDGLAANFNSTPKFGVDPARVGWSLIADVNTHPAPWPRGITGVSIHQSDAGRNLGVFRYLLFVAFPTETHDAQGHTFFGEIDVIEGK
ncbi:MAG TPA: hypothetical protein VGQ99_03905 [Tepidisphaeraceae bacterium]|nr:hypothetical protein [Tepidisphaeraceae bacterium]